MLDGEPLDFLDPLVAELAAEHPEADAQDITRIVRDSCSAVQMFDLGDDPDVGSLISVLARRELRLRLGLDEEEARVMPRARRGQGVEQG